MPIRTADQVRVASLAALVAKLDEYIACMGQELGECVLIAHLHGWRSSRVEKGERLRHELDALRRNAGI